MYINFYAHYGYTQHTIPFECSIDPVYAEGLKGDALNERNEQFCSHFQDDEIRTSGELSQ